MTPNQVEQLKKAMAFHQNGNLQEAKKIYEAHLKKDTSNVFILHLLGNVHLMQKEFQKALSLFNQAVLTDPNFVNVYQDRGLALENLNQLAFAVDNYKCLLALQPNDVMGLYSLGLVLHKLEQYPDALACLEQALKLKPDFADAHFSRGITLKDLRQLPLAIAAYSEALQCRPDFVNAYFNRGIAFHESGDLVSALADYDAALKLNPDFTNAHYNRGIALQELGHHDLAIESYDTAIRYSPDYVPAYVNRGIAFYLQQLAEDSIVSFDQALNINPEDPSAQFNKSLSLLISGKLLPGWELYEWRFRGGVKELRNFQFSDRLWDGIQSLANKTILILGEQGLGDIIQFCRFASLLTDQGAKVILEVPPTLKDLLKSLASNISVIAEGEPRPPFDYECPLLSLPHHLKISLDNIPSSGSYLLANQEKVAAWEKILGTKTKPRIGIVWSSVSSHTKDWARSMSLADILKIVKPEQYQYVCLQKVIKDQDQDTLKAHPEILFVGDQLHDMNDTAALIQNLDLVITVDTSVAHVSAALGKPTWILNRFDSCWRWLLDRNDSPWYASVRLYKQTRPGDWQTPLENIATDLSKTY